MLKCKILIKLFMLSFMLVCCGHSSWEAVEWDSDWCYWQIPSKTPVYTKFTQMQDEVSSLSLALNSVKFKYEALNHTVLSRIALNWTMWSQTISCIAKLSSEISTLLRYYTVLSGNSLRTFRDNLSIPSSRVKKSKRTENDWS
jgi:hypothetical protein